MNSFQMMEGAKKIANNRYLIERKIKNFIINEGIDDEVLDLNLMRLSVLYDRLENSIVNSDYKRVESNLRAIGEELEDINDRIFYFTLETEAIDVSDIRNLYM